MEWKKITDEKPPFKVGILISDGKIVTCAEAEDWGNEIWYHGHEFGGYEWEWNFNYETITHWAVLPTAPSDGEKV